MSRKLNLGLYLGNQQHGRASVVPDPWLPDFECAFNLQRLLGHPATHLQVQIRTRDQVLPGWQQATARLVINGTWLEELPLAWYDAEATDWPTGVVRFVDFLGEPVPTPPLIWVLAVRRSE